MVGYEREREGGGCALWRKMDHEELAVVGHLLATRDMVLCCPRM